MKTSAPIQNKPIIPSLFQIAAQFDQAAPAANLKSATTLNQSPFASLMFHPGKVKVVLKTEDSATGQKTTKRPTQSAKPTSDDGGGMGKPSGHSPRELKKSSFFWKRLQPSRSKLAANFTDWEKRPPADVTQK